MAYTDQMIRFFMRVLLVVFLLESTWAVAAQYCQHELGLDAIHFGHHVDKHKKGIAKASSHTVATSDQSLPNSDNDCPFCHLGAMKSMPLIMHQTSSAGDLSPLSDILITYYRVIPSPLERPNWKPAV